MRCLHGWAEWGQPNDDSKRKVRATLDQLRDKELVDNNILTDDYAQYTVQWSIEEASDGPDASTSDKPEEDDTCPC